MPKPSQRDLAKLKKNALKLKLARPFNRVAGLFKAMTSSQARRLPLGRPSSEKREPSAKDYGLPASVTYNYTEGVHLHAPVYDINGNVVDGIGERIAVLRVPPGVVSPESPQDALRVHPHDLFAPEKVKQKLVDEVALLIEIRSALLDSLGRIDERTGPQPERGEAYFEKSRLRDFHNRAFDKYVFPISMDFYGIRLHTSDAAEYEKFTGFCDKINALLGKRIDAKLKYMDTINSVIRLKQAARGKR